MKNGFIILSTDLEQLQTRVLGRLSSEQSVCSSVSDVNKLKKSDAVYFVISENAISSTEYQELVLTVIETIDQSSQWLLRLDDVKIPLGLAVLRSLPEGSPS